MHKQFLTCGCFAPIFFLWIFGVSQVEGKGSVDNVFARIQAHDFHPLNEERTFTHDQVLERPGIANLENIDWKVHLLAVRDLVQIGTEHPEAVLRGLKHAHPHVRYVSAMTVGILGLEDATDALKTIAAKDPFTVVRSQAVIALGQLESVPSLSFLKKLMESDGSRDLRHQCELAIDQIEKRMGSTEKQVLAFRDLDESQFELVEVGRLAPDFEISNTEGGTWRLGDYLGKKWVVLIWVFADWCPVCHGEFRDLIEMQDVFVNAGVEVVTLECHDLYRGRVMVGKELDPEYWFSERSFQKTYTEKIWWPHLLDRAGAVGALYGVDPLAFAVHAEYINRPSTIIIDPEGVVQFAYYGTYWGDRPTVKQTLDMIETNQFEFEHSERLTLSTGRSAE